MRIGVPEEQRPTIRPRLMTLRLMTWNVHGGIGPDRRFDLGRVRDLIARHRPDVFALQELDTRGRGPECLTPLRALAGEEGYLAQARTIVTPDGDYGHALFSRWPLTDIAVHDVSQGRREPRSALEARFAVGDVSCHIVAVHLGLGIGERWRQARRLVEIAAAGRPADLRVMMGDFNDWFPWRPVRRSLAHAFPERTRLRTFPARRPILRLDRIYSTAPVVASWTDTAARACSDHLPVIADIDIATPGNAALNVSAPAGGGLFRA